MFSRLYIATGLTLFLAFAFTSGVFAGGWAVITLDELPGQVVAGEPLEIGFMVRQHGVTPMRDLTPVISARILGLNRPVTATAKEEGEVGHYVATLTLPQAGEWEWTIQAFTANQPMPPLRVVSSPLVTEKLAQVSDSPPLLQMLATLLGAMAILVGLVAALWKRARWGFALIVAGITFGGVGFVSAAGQPRAKPDALLSSSAPPILQAELGRELFIAKGCMVCHSHVETNRFRDFGTDIGPALSNLTASPEYLRVWLKDPTAAKSTATMPNLELSEVEIEALIAFINAR